METPMRKSDRILPIVALAVLSVMCLLAVVPSKALLVAGQTPLERLSEVVLSVTVLD